MTTINHYLDVERQIKEKAASCGRQPNEITLIAVSKTYPIEALQAVYQEGGRNFGENRIQEALQKIPHLPSDCQWHLIGTLQSNKISKAIRSFQLIHSVDHPSLAQKISQASQAQGMTTSILLQVNVSEEKTKHGLSGKEWEKSLDALNQLSYIRIEGLMTMAPYTQDQAVIRSCFQQLYQLREKWRNQMKEAQSFHHLSMGMSNDFLIAIEEGATLLRIGSAIFGARAS